MDEIQQAIRKLLEAMSNPDITWDRFMDLFYRIEQLKKLN